MTTKNKGKIHQESFYTTEVAENWEQIEQWYSQYDVPPDEKKYWIFRGQTTDALLQTKLEKAFDLYKISAKKKRKRELDTIRRFQRKASLYLPREPDKDDILEWLAIMQHYGAPTRLIDWTYSFYIALYFALARNLRGAVWAFNAATVNKPKAIVTIIRGTGKIRSFNKFLRQLKSRIDVLRIRSSADKLKDLAITCWLIKHPIPLIYAVNPFRLNKRLTIQQGLFLLPGDIEESFITNLRKTFKDNDKDQKANLHKLVLEPNKIQRNKILSKLKDMNISNEVLFPGLDGFANSLSERLADRY